MFPNQDPNQPPYTPPSPNGPPQQHPSGQYEVVPPPSITGRPTGHNPYEFIVSPTTTQKSGGLGGNKFLVKIGLLIGGAVVLMIIIAIAATALLPNKSSTVGLMDIAEEQQEIIRIATLGNTQATSQATINFSSTVQYSLTTSQNQVLSYLAAHGGKPNAKQLALKQNSNTDKRLTAASATSTFDSAVQQSLSDQLTAYEGSLQTTYKSAGNADAKKLLQQNFNAAALLLKSVPSSSDIQE